MMPSSTFRRCSWNRRHAARMRERGRSPAGAIPGCPAPAVRADGLAGAAAAPAVRSEERSSLSGNAEKFICGTSRSRMHPAGAGCTRPRAIGAARRKADAAAGTPRRAETARQARRAEALHRNRAQTWSWAFSLFTPAAVHPVRPPFHRAAAAAPQVRRGGMTRSAQGRSESFRPGRRTAGRSPSG